MNDIKVTKSELIATLKKNRDEHDDIYNKAVVVYREKCVQELERMIAEAKAGGNIRHSFSAPVPERHVEDYDNAIEMLEWTLDDTIVLSEHDFRTYVRNEWGWAKNFAISTSSYLAR